MDSVSNILVNIDHLRTVRESFEDLKSTVKHHTTGTHITRTHASGSAGRLEASWDPSHRQFTDPGNDIWLRYKYDEQTWVMSVRSHSSLGRDAAATALVDKANNHAKRGRLNQMWHIYWMLILMSVTEYDTQVENIQFDLHFSPFSEADYLSPAEMGDI